MGERETSGSGGVGEGESDGNVGAWRASQLPTPQIEDGRGHGAAWPVPARACRAGVSNLVDTSRIARLAIPIIDVNS